MSTKAVFFIIEGHRQQKNFCEDDEFWYYCVCIHCPFLDTKTLPVKGSSKNKKKIKNFILFPPPPPHFYCFPPPPPLPLFYCFPRGGRGGGGGGGTIELRRRRRRENNRIEEEEEARSAWIEIHLLLLSYSKYPFLSIGLSLRWTYLYNQK